MIQSRPELANFRLALERAANRVELRRNDLFSRGWRPRSKCLDGIGEIGSPTGNTAGALVGVTFSIPLQRREAQGRLQRAEAELRETELRQRRTADQNHHRGR